MLSTQDLCRLAELLAEIEDHYTLAAMSVAEVRAIVASALEPRLAPAKSSAGSERAPRSNPRRETLVDAATFTIRWEGKACDLGNTLPFKLFQRLLVHPNQYVSYEQLMDDVWGGGVKSDDTVRSVVRHLKRRLHSAGMDDLAAAIYGRDHHYALFLDPPA